MNFPPRTRTARLLDASLWLAAWGSAAVITLALGWLLLDVAWRGAGELTPELLAAEPTDGGRAGGVLSIVVSTLLILAVCLAVSVPIGLAAAAWLSDFAAKAPRRSSLVRRLLDVLAGVPSIVFGLFGGVFFCSTLGLGYSILSGGLTLACMTLPILIRVSEEALRAVPGEHRQAAAGLGLSRQTTLLRVVLPAAAPALGAGVVLAIGRALAETAALIFTAGYVARMPRSLFDSGRALSVHLYDVAMNVPGGDARAYASALLLIGMLLVINAAATTLTRYAGRHAR